jgi:hypothetical protein
MGCSPGLEKSIDAGTHHEGQGEVQVLRHKRAFNETAKHQTHQAEVYYGRPGLPGGHIRRESSFDLGHAARSLERIGIHHLEEQCLQFPG